MSHLKTHFTPTNQELTASILELVRSVGSDGHYNPVQHTFRLRRIPSRLRRFFDVISIVYLGTDSYFICKPSTALEFSPTYEPDDEPEDPHIFLSTLHRHFQPLGKIDCSKNVADFQQLDFYRVDVGPVPAEDRWLLAFLEPRINLDPHGNIHLVYRLDMYKAFYLLNCPGTRTQSPSPVFQRTKSYSQLWKPGQLFVPEFYPSLSYQ